jgi:hypothetical protein
MRAASAKLERSTDRWLAYRHPFPRVDGQQGEQLDREAVNRVMQNARHLQGMSTDESAYTNTDSDNDQQSGADSSVT